MRIVVNGEPREVDDGLTVTGLLASVSLSAARAAVEVNGRLVRRADHAATALVAGDRVEVVTLVGGG